MKPHTEKYPSLTTLGLLLVIWGLIACSQEQQSSPLKLSDYPEYESEPAKLYVSKCSGCHAAPLPEVHVARQWSSVVQRMQIRMINKAVQPLTSNELAIVLDYLQKHARK